MVIQSFVLEGHAMSRRFCYRARRKETHDKGANEEENVSP